MDTGHQDPVGIVHVDISSLAFKDDIGLRQVDKHIVDRLVRVFNVGCSPDTVENQIPAFIRPAELDRLLQASQLTGTNLQTSLLGRPYPRLNLGQEKLYCLHGRHRLQAAVRVLRPEDCWWTIRLYSFEPGPRSSVFLQRQAEQFFHQTKFSDGEVYCNIRYYQQQEDVVQDWLLRLTNGKQDDISRLLKDEDLVRAFDRLLPFRGLWIGLELGNVRNLLALHCDEHVLSYLEHIYTTWDQITLRNAAIQRAVDIETVRNLQRRAPSASITDRQYIIHEMDNGALFPATIDANQRDAVKQALLGLEVIIPTIETFHDSLKYLSIGAKIVKTLLLGKERATTIYKSMRSHWSAPATTLEEFREMRFRDVTLERPDTAFHFCFMQVFVAALRQFPSLSLSAPMKEPKRKRGSDGEAISASINTACKSHFWKRAQLLGFRTDTIVDGLRSAEDLAVEVPEPFTEDNHGETIERRSGTPYTNAYKQFRTQLFLTNLRQARAESGLNPSVLFVQRDFLNAFFGWTSGSRRDLVPSTAPTPLFEPAAPLALPHPVPRYESEAAAASGPAVAETQVEIQINNPPRELVVSPQPTISSEGTLMISPQSSAYTGASEHWSQFSLPTFDESDSEAEGNGPQNQRERSLASMSDDRRSFPAPELRDEDDERRSFPPADLQDTDIWSPASIGDSDRRSFPGLEFRGGGLREEPRLFPEPELTDGEDERRSFPAAELRGVHILSPASTENSGRRSFPELESRDGDMRVEQHSFPTADLQGTDVWSSASTNSGRRSFPELEFGDGDMRVEHRSFPTAGLQRTGILSLASTDDSGRRSFPELEFQTSELVDRDDERRFPAVEVQSTSSGDLAERRSFPALELPDIEAGNERRSFPEPEIHEPGTSVPYVTVEAQRPVTNREVANQHLQHRPFVFTEHNSMTQEVKSTFDMEGYLEWRKDWIMMVLRHNVLKTIRFEDIVEHMRRLDEEVGEREYFLITRHYAEHFRTRYMNNLRTA